MVSTSVVECRLVENDRGPVARVTIMNRAKANCLTSEVVAGMRDAFQGLRENFDLRAAVLTGDGDRSFMGGANLGELKDFGPEDARKYLTVLSEANTAIRDLPVPVIARINGVCIGAGLEVAASCDLRIAAAHARLGMPEVALDLPSVVEAALFPRMMGWGRASWMLYRGDLLDAEHAERWGLVEKVVPEEELDAAVDELLGVILKNGNVGMRSQKALMRLWERLSISDGIDAGIDSIAEAFRDGEANTYIRDILDDLKK